MTEDRLEAGEAFLTKVPKVAILMATYNGERFLEEQLESFANQSEGDWELWASDDGSSDKTKSTLKAFANRFPVGKVNIVDGPKSGFANNFLSLINNPAIKAENYAYSDQDDIWFEDKLKRAISYLDAQSKNIPALYCSRTEYVDENMLHIGYSDDYQRPPSFQNALVQNIASGNTMVFNDSARVLMMKLGGGISIPLHDWWTYIIVTACDGAIFFDSNPTVRYRQHDGNLWGMNTGWINRAVRVKKLFEGRFKGWNDLHIKTLDGIKQIVAPRNQKVLNQFDLISKKGIVLRLYFLSISGLYRQTFLGNLGLWVAAFFNKI